MGPRLPLLPPTYVIGAELIYTFIIILLCVIIYFKTKEIYDLSKHKGIGFFRNTFLFFALSYLLRFFAQLFMFYSSFVHSTFRRILLYLVLRPNILFLSLVTYFSYAAILSLVFSSFWKIKETKFNWNILIHGLAFISTLVVFITGSTKILIGLQFLLFVAAIVMINISPKKKSAFSSLHITYYLLFLFWIVNLISFERGKISVVLNFVMNIFSLVIFYIITHRVVKRLSVNVKKKG